MMLFGRALISSDDPSLASDEVHGVETEPDSSISSTALGSLSIKLSLQLCLSLPSLRDWSSEASLLNEIAKTESENKEIKMQMRIEFPNWLYEFYCRAEIREGEGRVSERRSRAEATVSSMGNGDGAIVSLRAFLFLSVSQKWRVTLIFFKIFILLRLEERV
jgi:hypothetical protein